MRRSNPPTSHRVTTDSEGRPLHENQILAQFIADFLVIHARFVVSLSKMSHSRISFLFIDGVCMTLGGSLPSSKSMRSRKSRGSRSVVEWVIFLWIVSLASTDLGGSDL